MDNPFPSGTWLLIDAAGPWNRIGLVGGNDWIAHTVPSGDFLESLQPALQELLQSAQLSLESLSGTLYASGPGSTLGLRLAAMFIRSLMEIPSLSHWKCLQYQNMEVALASLAMKESAGKIEAVAPWRRDRYHHAVMETGERLRFRHGGIAAEEASLRTLTGFNLGRRPPKDGASIEWKDYPSGKIPAIISAFPELIYQVDSPTPYSAEKPEFARWSPKRHSAK